jgi:hypothetical protein
MEQKNDAHKIAIRTREATTGDRQHYAMVATRLYFCHCISQLAAVAMPWKRGVMKISTGQKIAAVAARLCDQYQQKLQISSVGFLTIMFG